MLIGLSGYAGSGKDEVAKILVHKGFERVAFADGVRDCLYALNPRVMHPESGLQWDLRALVVSKGWDRIKWYPEVRGLLQRMGVEAGREMFEQDCWITKLNEKFFTFDEDDIVIPDVRFPNEREWIMDNGGEVWRVTRPGYGPVNKHSSETALDTYFFDAAVKNDGTLDDLEQQILALIGDFGEQRMRGEGVWT